MTSIPHIASSTCDLALDYAYDELSDGAKAEFEKHLPTCARCQAEVEAFARVRGAVRAVMPMVEPPAATASMGSLHAQLMHAAAQRRPAGKVLSFGGRVKKVVLHPAFAMAASFVFVAGAVSLMYSHKQLVTPMSTPAATEAAAPVALPAMPAADAPAPAVAAAPAPGSVTGSNAAPSADAIGGVADKSDATPAKPRPVAAHSAAGKPMLKGKSDSLYLQLDDGKKLVVGEEKQAKVSVPPKSANSVDGVGGGSSLSRVQGGDGLTSEQKPSGPGSGTWNGQVRNFNNAADQRQKSEGAVGGYTRNTQNAPATQAPGAAPEPQPTMPPAATAPADTQAQTTGKRGYAQGRLALDENVDGLRRKADELAKGGRCDDAEKMYRQLEKTSSFHITVAERLNMVHCKTQVGQFQKAQDDIESLKVQRRDSPAIEREQEFLDRSRTRKTPVMQAPEVAAPAPAEAPSRIVSTPSTAPSPSKKAKKADSQADKAAY